MDKDYGNLCRMSTSNHSNMTMSATELKAEMSLDLKLCIISQEALKYGVFALAFIGTVSNCLTLSVLSRKSFHHNSSSVYLRVLATFDTLTLASYLLWALSHFYLPRMRTTASCKILNYLMASCPHVSSFILLTVTIEHFLAVLFPLKVRLISTFRRACLTCGLIIAVPFCYNISHLFIITLKSGGICGIQHSNAAYNTVWKVFHYFDAFIAKIMPAILIFLLNICTIIGFQRARAMRRRVLNNAGKNSTETRHVAKNTLSGSKHKKSEDNSRHLATMLIIASLSYWVLMLPSAALYITNLSWEYKASTQSTARFFFFFHVAYLLKITNCTINFILYVISVKRFRLELCKMLHI